MGDNRVIETGYGQRLVLPNRDIQVHAPRGQRVFAGARHGADRLAGLQVQLQDHVVRPRFRGHLQRDAIRLILDALASGSIDHPIRYLAPGSNLGLSPVYGDDPRVGYYLGPAALDLRIERVEKLAGGSEAHLDARATRSAGDADNRNCAGQAAGSGRRNDIEETKIRGVGHIHLDEGDGNVNQSFPGGYDNHVDHLGIQFHGPVKTLKVIGGFDKPFHDHLAAGRSVSQVQLSQQRFHLGNRLLRGNRDDLDRVLDDLSPAFHRNRAPSGTVADYLDSPCVQLRDMQRAGETYVAPGRDRHDLLRSDANRQFFLGKGPGAEEQHKRKDKGDKWKWQNPSRSSFFVLHSSFLVLSHGGLTLGAWRRLRAISPFLPLPALWIWAERR